VSWQEYLDRVHAHRRIKNTLSLERRLVRDVGPVEFRWGPRPGHELDQLIAWKSRQYRRSGWPDPFARRWVRELLDVIVDRGDGPLKPSVSTLQAGDELLAADFSLVYENVYAGWFATYNPDFATYSPGTIRMLHTIEQACTEGIVYIDLARGDEPYKRSFMTGSIDVATGVVHDRSPQALLYRAGRAPIVTAEHFVLRRPRVRGFVRAALRRFGRFRERH
jgi:CelD/BcsL family acetyltransferase involved in cellulose biosynthesis